MVAGSIDTLGLLCLTYLSGGMVLYSACSIFLTSSGDLVVGTNQPGDAGQLTNIADCFYLLSGD